MERQVLIWATPRGVLRDAGGYRRRFWKAILSPRRTAAREVAALAGPYLLQALPASRPGCGYPPWGAGDNRGGGKSILLSL